VKKQIYHVANRATSQNLGLYIGLNVAEAKKAFAIDRNIEPEDIAPEIIFDRLGEFEDFRKCYEIFTECRENPIDENQFPLGPKYGEFISDRHIQGLIDIDAAFCDGCPYAEEAVEEIEKRSTDWSEGGYPEVIENWITLAEITKENQAGPDEMQILEYRIARHRANLEFGGGRLDSLYCIASAARVLLRDLERFQASKDIGPIIKTIGINSNQFKSALEGLEAILNDDVLSLLGVNK
jgi:hypothetical protein